jgi:hypothetical protein
LAGLSNQGGFLLQSNEEIIGKIRQNMFAEIKKSVLDILKVHEVRTCIKDAKPLFTTSYNSSRTSSVVTYDLTQSNWSLFVTDLVKLSNKTMVDWTSKKKEMLYGKKFDLSEYPNRKQMVHVNPEIEFIMCELTEGHMIDYYQNNRRSYMTVETYNEFYLPTIRVAINKMVLKGYVDKSWIYFSDSIDTTHKNLTRRKNPDYKVSTAYSNNLIEILYNQIAKIYCKAVTLGTEFPTDLKIIADNDSIGFFSPFVCSKRTATAQGQVGLCPVAEQSS